MGRTKGFERNEVLAKAIQVFWKKGFADTSMSDLEKATGVNKSGLYAEFKDKDDLFVASLKHYGEQHPVEGILTAEPLGWNNIEKFLKMGMVCTGQKGCFLAYTLRELSIVPLKARQLIDQNSTTVRNDLIANIKATGTKKNPEMLADILMTFNTGISLKLNAIKPDVLVKEADSLLEWIKA